MITTLLVSGGETKNFVACHGSDHFGLLRCPRDRYNRTKAEELSCVRAADNDAFSGFDEVRYKKMCDTLDGTYEWVSAPDVVGDWRATLKLFVTWAAYLRSKSLRTAFVGQDGVEADKVPWDTIQCYFVGGTDAWKFSADSRRVVDTALDRGKWVHIGRVNSYSRAYLCHQWSARSIDGSSFSRFASRTPGVVQFLEDLGPCGSDHFWCPSNPRFSRPLSERRYNYATVAAAVQRNHE